MFRNVAIASLIAFAAPLCAGELMDQLFDGKKPEKVGREWFKGLPVWLNKLAREESHAWSWFRSPDDKLRRYRIDQADASELKTRELQETGKLDDDGKPERVPAGDVTIFKWTDWESTWLASTYPVETNPSEVDVVGFAAWLYEERKAAVVANRVLTTVYLNEKYKHLCDAIAEFICEQENLKPGTKLATFDVWDEEVRVFRTILIPANEAEEFREVRQEAARARLMELRKEHDNVETRTLTLARLQYELKQWVVTFGETAAAKDESLLKLQSDLLEKIDGELKLIADYVKLGETFLADKKPDPAKAAEKFEAALALDSYDLKLLSQAANARFQDAHPQLQETKSRIVGNENAVAAAMGLYERWHERESANVKVLLCIGQLHHLKGETDKAKKQYDRVILLDLDPPSTKNARTLRKAADANPQNR
jgi:hypothetical protein